MPLISPTRPVHRPSPDSLLHITTAPERRVVCPQCHHASTRPAIRVAAVDVVCCTRCDYVWTEESKAA